MENLSFLALSSRPHCILQLIMHPRAIECGEKKKRRKDKRAREYEESVMQVKSQAHFIYFQWIDCRIEILNKQILLQKQLEDSKPVSARPELNRKFTIFMKCRFAIATKLLFCVPHLRSLQPQSKCLMRYIYVIYNSIMVRSLLFFLRCDQLSNKWLVPEQILSLIPLSS